MLCTSRRGLCAVAVMLLSGAAWGEEGIGSVELGTPLAQEALEQRGTGAGVQMNLQETTAIVHNNSAIDTVSGSNHIGDNAFRDTVGFPLAVQNSGNNVVIQNAVIINLDMR